MNDMRMELTQALYRTMVADGRIRLCGDCFLWMKSTCPKEVRHHLTGSAHGSPTCSSPACEKFAPKSPSESEDGS